jgi:hypothetical protein
MRSEKKKTRKIKNKKNKTKKCKKGQGVYTSDEFNSGDGMLTTVWGPPMWHYLHTMSFNYPVNPTDEDKSNYTNFMLSLQYVLPCKYCRINLTTNYRQLPLTMEKLKNRESFSRYVYDLHELVNRMLNKKSGLTYDEVRERYEHFRARCTEEKPILFKIKKPSEKGCTEPLYGKKSKCMLKIVPQEAKGTTFQMDKKCIKTRG